MEIISKYKNGNYTVTIFDDGTKIRENDLDYFDADFPESIDCKITDYCERNCPMCYAKSSVNGLHGNIMNMEFIDHLHKGTEMAIGGGAVTSHPQLVKFLKKLKTKGVIPSITVHQKEYEENEKLIEKLIDEELIYGLGISFNSFNDELWDRILKNDNAVVHLIAGLAGENVLDYFAQKNAKILILGYKDFGRGHDLLEKRKAIIDMQLNWLKENIKDYMAKFKVVAFDNLAITQLAMQEQLTGEQWKKFYQGNDGTHTMYVDMVNEQFAKTSTSTERYNILSNLDDMFKIVKGGN